MADGQISAIVDANIDPFKKKLAEAKALADKFYSEVSKAVSIEVDSAKFLREVSAARSAVQALEREIQSGTRFDADVRPFVVKIENLKSTFDRVIELLKSPLPISANITPFQDKLKLLEQDVAALQGRLNKAVTVSINVDSDTLRTKLDTLDVEIEDFRRKIMKVDKFDANTKEIQTKITALLKSVKSLHAEIKKAPMADIKTENFTKKLTAMSKRVTVLQGKIRASAAFMVGDADAIAKLNKIKKLVDGIKSSISKKYSVSIGTKGLKDSLTKLSDQLKAFAKKNKTSIIIDINFTKFDLQLEKASKKIDTFAARFEKKLNVGKGAKNLTDSIREVEKTLKSLQSLVEPLKEIAAPLRSANKSFGTLAAKLDLVAISGDKASLALNRVGQSLLPINNAMNAATQRIKQNADAVKAMGFEQRQAEKSVAKLERAMDRAQKGVNRTKSAVNTATDRFAKFDRVMDGLADSAALVTGPLGGVASRVQVLSRAVQSGTAAIVTIAAAVTGMGIALGLAAKEAEKFQTSQLRLQGVLKATGSAAGVTAAEIIQFASDLDGATLGSEIEIQAAAAQLITFGGIAKDVFKDVIRAAQAYSDVGLGSVAENTKRFAKALKEPAKAGDSLREVGIQLSDTTVQMAEKFVELGEVTKAQRLILNEIKGSVQGVSEEMGSGFAGAVDSASKSWSELLRTINDKTGALDKATKLVLKLNDALQGMRRLINNNVDPGEAARLKDLTRQYEFLNKVFKERGLDDRQRYRMLALKEEIGRIKEATRATEERIRKENEKAQAENEATLKREANEKRIKEARDKAAAEQNRINSLREVSLRSLREENKILVKLSMADADRTMTSKQFEETKKEISRAVRLGVTDETRSVAALEKQVEVAKERFTHEANLANLKALNAAESALTSAKTRDALSAEVEINREITAELEKQSLLKTTRESDEADIALLNAKVEAQRILTESMGKGEDAQRSAEVRAETEIRLAKRIIDFRQAGKELTREEIELQREAVRMLVAKEQQLDKLVDATDKLKESQDDALQRQMDFQESLASGLADLITSTGSWEDSIKKLILQLSKAAVEARILAAIQFASGTGTGEVPAGAKGNATGGLIALGKSIFSSYFGKGDEGGNVIEGLTGQKGGATVSFMEGIQAHQGGVVGNMAKTRKIPTPVAINAPRYHEGLRPNEVPAILEKGEEVIPKDQVGRRRTGNTNITFNVTTSDADSFRRSQRQMSRQARQAVAR